MQDIESLLNTIKIFKSPPAKYGTHVPPYLEKAILGFMKDAMGIELEERETRKVDIDVDTVQSGDFIGTMRTDGLGLII